jgi:DNA-binding GntR family transcriptional regulator
MVIDRSPLRDQVYREVVDRILAGAYPAGSRVSDRALADLLSVSRTPVREALMRLERERLLDSDPHRGFFVRALTVEEVHDVYPVIGMLEAGLVRRGATSDEVVDRLARLNERLERSEDDPLTRVELDMRWHQTVTRSAGNRYADDLLSAAKNLVRRYEYAYMRESGHVPLSVRMHEEIGSALASGDFERAARLLEDHWQFGMRAVERWLDVREPAGDRQPG